MGSHEEIVTGILSRLPVKSLLRFKCVSKFWNTSICDPYFKKKHAKNQSSPKLLIGQSCSDGYFYLYSSSLSPSSKLVKDIRKLDYPSSFKPTHCRVYCCCDGLSLIGIWSTMHQAEITPRLFLWNPSTGESILLPSHLEIPPLDEYIYGLGYDATSDDYKILRVDVYDEIPDEILALKSGSWRKIEGRRSIPIISLRELCLAFVHGAFHWLSTLPRRYCLVSLNISSELYQEISLPKILLSSTSFIVQVGVSVLGGKLSIYNSNGDIFCIWVLEDYGVKESWTKWFTLPTYRAVPGLYIIPIYRFSDDEVLLSYFNAAGIIYRTSNRSLEASNRMLPLQCDDTDVESIQDGLVYTESLISPKELIV